jgi:ATP-dependent DNA helicase
MENGKALLRTDAPEIVPKVETKGKQSRRKSQSGKKRARTNNLSDVEDEEEPAKRTKLNDDALPKFKQPSLVTGATLKDYQLEGVEWMVGLDSNGVSGILGVFHSS